MHGSTGVPVVKHMERVRRYLLNVFLCYVRLAPRLRMRERMPPPT